jgi:acyl-CoA synthetase (NDP forming)
LRKGAALTPTQIAAITAIVANGAVRAAAGTAESFRLNEVEVYGILAALGWEHAPIAYLERGADAQARTAWAARARELAGARGSLFVKGVGRRLLHKTEAGAVVRLEKDGSLLEADILAAADGLTARLGAGEAEGELEGVLAAAAVPHRTNQPGQELLLGVRLDAAFGPVVMVGIGGTLTEWYGSGSGGRSRLIVPAAGFAEDRFARVLERHPLLGLCVAPSRLYAEPPLAAAEVTRAVGLLAELGLALAPDSGQDWTLEELEVNPAVAADGRLVALDGVGLVSRRRWPRANRPLAKISPLLAPRSAVVFGVSKRGANPGRIILDNLKRSPGVPPERIYVVHPHETNIAGVACYRNVEDLPEKCDLAIVAIPAEGAFEAIAALVRHDRAESIILIPGGFAEAGQRDLAERIETVLREGHAAPGGGPVLVGGNCLGIVSRDEYNTFFLPEYKLPFRSGRGENLALVSQSGAYLVTFASNYDGIISPRASISYGNQMDLTAADFLEHYAGRERIDVIGFYIEGFRPGDGARFLAAARRARARGQRVIVFKAGKTELGARAAASHTASLAGDYDVARDCLAAAGVAVAESLDEFEDLLKTFSLLAKRPPRGRRIGVLSNAGFECSTVTDALAGLELATFDAATLATLADVLPPFAHRDNPIDCTPMADTEAFVRSAEAVLACAGVDAGVISSVPVTPALDNLAPDPGGAHSEDVYAADSQAQRLIDIFGRSAKPVVFVVDSGRLYDPLAALVERAGVPVFRKIDRAARALAAFAANI